MYSVYTPGRHKITTAYNYLFCRISGIFNDFLKINNSLLPTISHVGTTGEYTCEICHGLKGQQMLCANSTISIIGVPGKNDSNCTVAAC